MPPATILNVLGLSVMLVYKIVLLQGEQSNLKLRLRLLITK